MFELTEIEVPAPDRRKTIRNWSVGVGICLVAGLAVAALVPVAVSLLLPEGGGDTCFSLEKSSCDTMSKTDLLDMVESAAEVQFPAGAELLFSRSSSGAFLAGPTQTALVKLPAGSEIMFDARYEDWPVRDAEAKTAGRTREALDKYDLDEMVAAKRLWNQTMGPDGAAVDSGSVEVNLASIKGSEDRLALVIVRSP